MESGTNSSTDFNEIPTSASLPRGTVSKEKTNRLWYLYYGIIGVLLLVLIILIVAFGISRNSPSTEIEQYPGGESYHSPAYYRAGIRLHLMLNSSVNPCEDFYEFACGKGLVRLERPKYFANFGTMMQLQERVFNQLDQLLRSSEPSYSKSIEKVKTYYTACLDEKNYVHLMVEGALERIRSLGDFPMLQGTANSASIFNWSEYLLSLAKNGQGPSIFNLNVGNDPKNGSKKIITFSRSEVPLREEVYWNNETVFGNIIQAYKKRTKKILEMLAQDAKLPPNPHLDEELDDLFTLYHRWAKIGTQDTKNGLQSLSGLPLAKGAVHYGTEASGQKFSSLVDRFESKTGLNLRILLKALAPVFAQDFLSNEDLEVSVSPRLEDDLIAIIQETSPNTWKNFYQLAALEEYLDYFPEKYSDVIQEVTQEIDGTSETAPRWKKCGFLKALNFVNAFDALYVRTYSDPNTIKEATEMISNLRESFSQIVQEANWLDAETKKNALVKLNQMVASVGYHEDLLDDVKLDERYGDLNIDKQMNFATIWKEYNKWRRTDTWKITLKPSDRHRIAMPASFVNAGYSLNLNSIIIPLAVLQEPAFDGDGPKSINYGAIGAVIGHEITHGFDSLGRHFDEIGNFRDWWTNSSAKNFKDKTKEMVEQYNNYEMKEIGMSIDGKFTLGENIADNGGIKEAFRAYKAYLEKNGREKRIPGFDYINEQLFYIGWGHFWCTKATPEFMKGSLLTDPHSPSKARVNVAVSNQPEFAEAFKCPAGSPMNPVKKVTVW